MRVPLQATLLKNMCQLLHYLRAVLCLAIVSSAGLSTLQAQRAPGRGIAPFKDLVLRIDTLEFSYNDDRVTYRQERHLAFRYENEETVAELRIYPFDNLPVRPNVSLMRSSDYDILDSLVYYDEGYFRTRLRFKSLSATDFLSINISTNLGDESRNLAVPLLPYTNTRANIYVGEEDLYIGEEKRYEIVSNNISNLKLSGEWQTQGDLEYRLFERDGTGYLSVIPNRSGVHVLELNIETKRPMITATLQTSFQLETIQLNFLAKGSRLIFLRTDQREIIREKDNREGIEIQIDFHRTLQIGKTYRIEDREEPGGPLIAELFTQRLLSNDRVLCILRPYANHSTTDGYLFIKDGDKPQFITNVNISPEASISGVAILRDGGEWTASRTLKPGETVDLRLEGEGLRLARFHFEDLIILETDSATRNDRAVQYKIMVPIDIKRKKVEIYNRDKKMGLALSIAEYQRPRPLDFVMVDYGDGPKVVSAIKQTILYPHIVRELVIEFDYNKIDSGDRLYGRQWLEVEVRLTGSKNELIEMQQIPLIGVCPGDASPRSGAYGSTGCNIQPIRINSLLSRKTHSLREWSRIELVIRHKTDRYDGEGYSQRISIVQQKLVTFDVDLSFPAGLIISRVGESGFPGLTGISLAMLAQFSFYDKEAIQKQKPYKVGAGFLAINALNFNPEVEDRDLGIVILGSVYPTRSDRKLSFPLFAGAGYFLNADQFFFLIGPGIRVNF